MTDEERRARVHYHEYESLEGIAEHAERIVALEELCQEMLPYVADACPGECLYREECQRKADRETGGLPATCVAYDHIRGKLSKLDVEVDRG